MGKIAENYGFIPFQALPIHGHIVGNQYSHPSWFSYAAQNQFSPAFNNHVNKEDNTNSSAPPPLDMNSLSYALPQYQALSSHEVSMCQANGMQTYPDILRNGNGMSSQ